MRVKLEKHTDFYWNNKVETTRLGFTFAGGFVTEPFDCEDGKIEVNPVDYYGLTQTQLYEMDKFNQQDPGYLEYTG